MADASTCPADGGRLADHEPDTHGYVHGKEVSPLWRCERCGRSWTPDGSAGGGLVEVTDLSYPEDWLSSSS
jgi:hypothetical protein